MTRAQLDAEFAKYDRENPLVWSYFKRFTFDLIAAGKKHGSASLVIERIRWEVYITTRSSDGFKINNNHRAYYSRKFMREFPEHDGFFHTRKQKRDPNSGYTDLYLKGIMERGMV